MAAGLGTDKEHHESRRAIHVPGRCFLFFIELNVIERHFNR